ncbi:MAG: CheR family methyltransferase [Candidatus Thorarchaeota archaeon]
MNPGNNIVALGLEEGLSELLDFLQSSGIEFSPKSECRVIKKLKIMVERHGLEDYFELLNLLQINPQSRKKLIKWLERGKLFNEEENSFTPLVKREKSLGDSSNTPKKKSSRKNIFNNCENLNLKQVTDDDWIESEKDYRKILDFLDQKKIKFASKDETRILCRLKLIARKIGFKNYFSLIKLLNSDPHTLEAVIHWLEKGRVYNEEEKSFSPLVKRGTVIQRSVSRKTARKISNTELHKAINLNFVPSIPNPTDIQNLSLIYNFLSRNNVNYETYKEKYFLRRLHSRMMKTDVNTYLEYVNILETDSSEVKLLVDNLSINVTRFFRDKDLWSTLEVELLPKIVDNSKTARIWSAGCAVGPEPYSIAMLMFNKLKSSNLDRLYILATDLRQEFLEQAQAGVYSHKLLVEINPDKIQTYFKPITPELFQLSNNIREKVIFKKHDLREPPPSRNFDLILCRNVLIYFSRKQAETLFQRFHTALKPNGYLVLGKCELVPIPVRHLFKVVDSRTRVYQRKSVVT